jgi:tRNA pseudouridine38-40 synthase
MMRIALGIEYDGYAFKGWQAQTDLYTVQGCLEQALSIVAATPINTFCAGRTDAGVHATGQVVHFETSVKRELRAWTFGVNANLPASIVVRWAQPVREDFHARFSALSRRYRYIIYNHNIRSAVLANKVTVYHQSLDVASMQLAAHHLVGEHDFTSFRSAQCESHSPFRNVTEVSVIKQHDFIILEIEANAFLQHMVRNIVGALIKVGEGRAHPSWIKELLQAKDRRKAAATAAPCGLYLIKVNYPSHYQLPAGIERGLF